MLCTSGYDGRTDLPGGSAPCGVAHQPRRSLTFDGEAGSPEYALRDQRLALSGSAPEPSGVDGGSIGVRYALRDQRLAPEPRRATRGAPGGDDMEDGVESLGAWEAGEAWPLEGARHSEP